MNPVMNYNYHTHTKRCQHAYGEDREYVESAIKAGIKKLGFSDHVPYPFPNGFVSRIRMRTDEVENYVTSIRSLQKEYEKDIQIFVGFEAEYFKEHWNDLCHLLAPYDIDYLILGQHFCHSETTDPYTGAPTANEKDLKEYVDVVIEAINTGCFSYIAHPDLINFTGNDDIYRKHMTRLCLEAKKLHLPLEINFAGYLSRRHYPGDRFFTLASSLGNTFVLGRDAHSPDAFFDNETLHQCLNLVQRCNITTLEQFDLRKPEF